MYYWNSLPGHFMDSLLKLTWTEIIKLLYETIAQVLNDRFGHNWTALGVFFQFRLGQAFSCGRHIGRKPTGSTTRSPMSVRDDVC